MGSVGGVRSRYPEAGRHCRLRPGGLDAVSENITSKVGTKDRKDQWPLRSATRMTMNQTGFQAAPYL